MTSTRSCSSTHSCLKICEGGTVQRRALYLALGVTLDGDRDVLGMWFQETEGAKVWMQVLTDLKQRGVRDILIAASTASPASLRRSRRSSQDDRADVHRALCRPPGYADLG